MKPPRPSREPSACPAQPFPRSRRAPRARENPLALRRGDDSAAKAGPLPSHHCLWAGWQMVEEMSKLSRDKVIGCKESSRQVMPQHVSRTPRLYDSQVDMYMYLYVYIHIHVTLKVQKQSRLSCRMRLCSGQGKYGKTWRKCLLKGRMRWWCHYSSSSFRRSRTSIGYT